ncbi:PP2C family protein-serine/threonine phosphatase [Streptomyces sp. NPDC018019]|uniref:PP2C family protein-serine/threonine phosphatase n=1 Tax=Streptomyces sp. NPDC018019 TaxID=3365030 RepID=UPI0037B22CCC
MRLDRDRGWLLLALLSGVPIAVGDLLLGPAHSLAGLLLICALLAATRLDGPRTGAVSLYALLLAAAVAAREHDVGERDMLVRLAVLVLGGAYATWSAAQRVAHERRLTESSSVAQRAILQPTSFRLGSTAVCARYHSASPQALIGGDLYAFAHTPTGLRLLIGDVRGKGLQAVRLAAAAIGFFRDSAYTHPDLPAVLAATDRRLTPMLGPEDFVTALAAEFTGAAGPTSTLVRLANCGHHPPLLLPADGTPRLIAPAEPATPLGLHPAPAVQDIVLGPGDRMLFYTDGLAEARNAQGAMVDLADLRPACSRAALEEAADAVQDALLRHTDGDLADDVAFILVEVCPTASDRGARARSGTRDRTAPAVGAAHSPCDPPRPHLPRSAVARQARNLARARHSVARIARGGGGPSAPATTAAATSRSLMLVCCEV